MTRNRRLNIEEGALARFCEKHHIRRLSLFGSQLKGTARADSDVDLLVEFDPEHIPRLLGIASMESELSDMFGGVGGGGGGAAPAGCEGSGTDGGVSGADVRVTLEIDARLPNRAPDNVVRIVTENCRTLKFESQGFEKE